MHKNCKLVVRITIGKHHIMLKNDFTHIIQEERFLIRGDEGDLLVLDQEWEAVQIQTSCKLERCHKPVTQESGEKDTSFF